MEQESPQAPVQLLPHFDPHDVWQPPVQASLQFNTVQPDKFNPIIANDGMVIAVIPLRKSRLLILSFLILFLLFSDIFFFFINKSCTKILI
jgi:hypothetical protein